jgi:UbiD family decarboxylase
MDDDIDPTNFSDVVWAMCTRCDPRDQVDIIHGGWSSAPHAPPGMISYLLIGARQPFV